MPINKYFAYVKIIHALGIRNVIRVAIYRMELRIGYYRLRLPIMPPLKGPFVDSRYAEIPPLPDISLQYFSVHDFTISGVPDWFRNPWNENPAFANSLDHWSKISDFSATVGDIKTIWEPSRFDWAPKFAWQATQEGPASHFETRIELWLRDWTRLNPPNQGINWKCGQEVSLRAMNLLLTIKILKDTYNAPTSGLLNLFESHVLRISPTTSYAKAQDNNHGTSEAAALFCVGNYLLQYGNRHQKRIGAKSMAAGRKLLENRVRLLIMEDGSFSQLSTNYHRLMLDTLVLCELTRRHHKLAAFTTTFHSRVRAATLWLMSMMDLASGDVANLGSNDGAYFANIENLPYRDYRPTLKRALALFCDTDLGLPATDALLDIYAVSYQNMAKARHPPSGFFPDGGFARLNLPQDTGHLIFRYPKYAFRPANCDANHVDLWVNGRNITLDAGSFSYNTDNLEYQRYFGGTTGHCTISFDDHDQMPKLGRMLRGNWLTPEIMRFDETKTMLESQYTDYTGAWHKRRVSVGNNEVIVQDECGGFKNKAVLRWRLLNDEWVWEADTVSSPQLSVKILSTSKHTTELVYEKNSLHYLEITDIPVMKITFHEPSIIETRILISQS